MMRINLDAMTTVELHTVQRNCTRLAEYAAHKRLAMIARAAGEINKALQEEAICDDIYAEISPDWRW